MLKAKLVGAYRRGQRVLRRYQGVGSPAIETLGPLGEGVGEFAILCDGGLCNRLNCLVVGYYTARALGRVPVIVWAETEVCDCAIERLLVVPEGIEVRRAFDIESVEDAFAIWHMTFRETDLVHPNAIGSWQRLEEMLPAGKVMYSNNLLVDWVDLEVAFALFKRDFGVNAAVREAVDGFIAAEGVREAVGLHFRTTDFAMTFESYRKLLEKALRLGRRVFVCSDAEDAENRALESSDQLFRRDKSAYVDKKDEDKPWVEGETYNVYRSEMAIIDGMIDLYILSATRQQFGNPNSTFFKFAQLLRY